MTTIFWFSGTGNSLAVARDIAGELDEATLEPIAKHRAARVAVEGAVGIVCPVYFYGLPLIVRDFLDRLDVSRAAYAFIVLTAGGFPGRAGEEARARLRRAGRAPDAVYSITTPGNYIAMYDVRAGDALQGLVAASREDARRVGRGVRDRASASDQAAIASRAVNAVFAGTFGRVFAATCRTQDRKFEATDACTRCGVCARVCPVSNIELTDGRPRWLGHCEQCFACIHWCPAAAIQIRGKATAKRGRYHHPDVTLDDIAPQRG
jgi:Pyruvate/2-oxoacid:ferredoxin oxidoreductase delta subunit/flavodoxin